MATKSERSKKKQVASDTTVEENKSFTLSKIKEFTGEVKAEFDKIVWPDKKMTMGSTGVVIVLVIIISIYLGAVDLFIGKLVSYIIK